MDPWYKVVTPRKEVREGRSFDPAEFAIALEQVVAGTAPTDYRDPEQFFDRTHFTGALSEHAGMVLRRLAGETTNTSPVLTLITQFGGGKTHTLTALYHMANSPERSLKSVDVQRLVREAGLSSLPAARPGVFVGNAWDPREGRETPWLDIARQVAGDAGPAILGPEAADVPPGTETLQRLFAAAGGPVLLLFDEVLNFVNRHRRMADAFHAFLQNLTVAATGQPGVVAVISLPRSQVEMTDWDMQWQDKITKIVRRVARDLIANDESEIAEVVRKRLFEGLGDERKRRAVAKAYADWCFERRAQLPPEWTAVDSTLTERGAREFLQVRFEACYPFHPATLSVFQRKWQVLAQYQQTRGTLAMLAQWVSLASLAAYKGALNEPLITLGRAPLEDLGFRSVVLGQLGEARLGPAIETDISGERSHARSLDADAKGPLRDLHQKVGTAILFESSGGQVDKVAHKAELRFAVGGPDLDTTSIDNAAVALTQRAFFIRSQGTDGYRIHHKPKIEKVVSDRRASLDPEKEIKPAVCALVERAFRDKATLPLVLYPEDSSAIPDTPRLTLVVADPDNEWEQAGMRARVAEWTTNRGQSARLYPGALIWCVKKSGRELRDKVEMLLAWKRVQQDVRDGSLGSDLDVSELRAIESSVKVAEGDAIEQVWGGYRYVTLSDSAEPDRLRVLDLGAGHSSSGESLCGRVVASLKSNALLNDSVGAGYIERNWPPALRESGEWPLGGLRQSFLNGSLTRLPDPDAVLRAKIPEFVERGELGLASGSRPDGTYARVWFGEPLSRDEVAFEPGVFLLTRERARQRLAPPVVVEPDAQEPTGDSGDVVITEPNPPVREPESRGTVRVRLAGELPPELWNKLGLRMIPKLKGGSNVRLNVEAEADFDGTTAGSVTSDLRGTLAELGLDGFAIEQEPREGG